MLDNWKPSEEQIEIVVAFWMMILEVSDQEKRSAFEEALRELMNSDSVPIMLYNDYDPQRELLDCVQKAGIKCKGYMFSGRGIFPDKTETTIRYSKGVEIKLGYANWIGNASSVDELNRMLAPYNIGPNSSE